MAFEYINVQQDPEGMKAMLKWSKGKRTVPVIVDNGQVQVGYGGAG